MTSLEHSQSEGKILILATETCAYPGADSVGQAHSSYPANTFILRKKHKSKVQGVHIMLLGWTDIVPDILEQTEIKINGVAG